MKKYKVLVSRLQYGEVYVEAENEDEATKKATDLAEKNDGEIGWHDCEVTDTQAYESTMSRERMERILADHIELDKLGLDDGIFVFYIEGTTAIGVSREKIEEAEVYIFNLFSHGEYINIGGKYINVGGKFVDSDGDGDLVVELAKEWNNLLKGESDCEV